MRLFRLVVREVLYRKLGFALAVLSVVVAVGCLVSQLSLLRQFDQRTEELVAAREEQTRRRTAKLEDDFRKITKNLGFNILILPRDQNLADLYAEDFASKYMPEHYVQKLADAKVATINHVVPSLQQKLRWPERDRTILLMGVKGAAYIHDPKQKPMLDPVPEGGMILGYELHRSMKLGVGDAVLLAGQTFKVTKLQPERGTKDDITVWINLARAQSILNKPGLINSILALDCACAGDRLAMIRQEVEAILPDTQVIEFASQAIARAESRQRAQAEAEAAVLQEVESRAALREERQMLAAVLTPIVLLGCGVWVGLLALANVRERTAEIGLLRALGLRSVQILAVFLGRAVVVGGIGGLLGYVVGILAGRMIPDPAGAASGMATLDLSLLFVALLAAPLLTSLASWVPALLASRQDPAQVLRDS